jgi:transcriptional regulator with XRE-family HTH domain
MLESYDTKIFGEKLKELRSSLGFSQAEVSRETSIKSLDNSNICAIYL